MLDEKKTDIQELLYELDEIRQLRDLAEDNNLTQLFVGDIVLCLEKIGQPKRPAFRQYLKDILQHYQEDILNHLAENKGLDLRG